MWTLIPLEKAPPTRIRRYCCAVLKEQAGRGRFIATGIRWDESAARLKRGEYEALHPKKERRIQATDEIMLSNDNSTQRLMIEKCIKKAKMVVNPIIEWTNADVWDYIRSEIKVYNPLYNHGYYRVGCVGCPMANKGRWKEFRDFPTYQAAYIRAFDRMLEMIPAAKTPSKWKTGEHVFRWWMEDENLDGQLAFDLDGKIYEEYT